MDVTFDSETKKVKQIFAAGNVVIVRAGDTTRSNRAIYSFATGSIRLEGNPEITLHKGSTALLDGAIRN
jgi:lipopolysaccharide assembly outer membrane protein LptD (OstA)